MAIHHKKDGMVFYRNICIDSNWENHGKFNGDIDHIIPLSSVTSESEIILLNHYTNMQPLCSKINRHEKRGLVEYTI